MHYINQLVLIMIILLLFFFLVKLNRYNFYTFKIAIVIITIIYFTISGIFWYIDKYALFQTYKIQKDVCISDHEYREILIRVVTIYGLIVIPILYFFWIYAMPYRVSKKYTIDTNKFVFFVIGYIICILLGEISSWVIHRGLHYFTFLYENIHKFHHQHIAPVALASIDAHPLEVIFWDGVPLLLGPFLIGAKPTFTLFFITLGIINTLAAHAGYNIYNYFELTFHDLHHERMKCNYGSDLFMDIMMGTYMKRDENTIYPKWNMTEKTLEESYNIYCKTTINDI